MKKILNTRKKVIIASAAAGAIVLGTGGAAYAYFATSGSGTGSATVGTAAATWTVAAASATGGPLYPGSGAEKIVFTVTNSGTTPIKLTNVTPTVNADTNGLVTQNKTSVSSCYAGWFNAAVAAPADEPGLNTEIAGGGQTTVTVTVTMPADESDNQNACAGKSPDIDLNVS